MGAALTTAKARFRLYLCRPFHFCFRRSGVPTIPQETPSDFSVDGIVLTMKRRPVTAVVLVGIVLMSSVSAAFMLRESDPVDEPELARQLAADLVRYSAALRQSPVFLADELAPGALEQGDAVSYQNRFEDYYVYESSDSSSFSLVVTSAEFAPDVLVVTPDGRRLAASTLMQTDHRAEAVGLAGAGRYEITVTSREPGDGGPYELSAGLPDVPIVLSAQDPTFEDTLGIRTLLRAGRYEHRYHVEARPGEPVILSIYAKDFTPNVHLLGPEGEVTQPWSSVEQRTDAAGIHVTILRFRPGSEAPYLVLATSEERAAQGPYIVELATIRTLAIRTDGRDLSGDLGERSWFRDGRYVDTYGFRGSANDKVVIDVRSAEFAPKLVLRRGERNVATAEGGQVARIEQALGSTSSYEIDVTSVDENAGGSYTVTVTIERAEEPEGSLQEGGSRSFNTSASRVGSTNRGHSFEVAVTSGTITGLPGGRVQIQLNVRERSVDFEGEWDAWARRARHAWVTDDTGQRYDGAPAEARGGEGETVTMGGARSGRLSFYGSAGNEPPSSITLHFPIGSDRGIVVSVPISLQR